MKHIDRRERILQAGLMAAEQIGYSQITRAEVAQRAEVSESLVQYHFNSVHELKKEILAQAIRDENLPILAQALGSLDPDVLDAPVSIQARVLEFIDNALKRRPNANRLEVLGGADSMDSANDGDNMVAKPEI